MYLLVTAAKSTHPPDHASSLSPSSFSSQWGRRQASRRDRPQESQRFPRLAADQTDFEQIGAVKKIGFEKKIGSGKQTGSEAQTVPAVGIGSEAESWFGTGSGSGSAAAG